MNYGWRRCRSIALALLLIALLLPIAPALAADSAESPVDQTMIRDAAALVPAPTDSPRILVLGELHGTHEAPALAAELVRIRVAAGMPTTLALEVHVSEQSLIETFLASSGDESARMALLEGAYWQVPAERSDGRRSVAMLELIESVRAHRAAGGDVRVLVFDAGNAGVDANERNRHMAAVLRRAFDAEPERAFVVLTGNYHARRAAPASAKGLAEGFDPPMPTMAHLVDLPMLRINITAETGEFWACADGVCGPRPVGPGGLSPQTLSESRTSASFRFTPNDSMRWNAQLRLPRFTAAAPVVP